MDCSKCALQAGNIHEGDDYYSTASCQSAELRKMHLFFLFAKAKIKLHLDRWPIMPPCNQNGHILVLKASQCEKRVLACH